MDDIKIMMPKRKKMIEQVKSKLISAFSIVNMGPISFYLGIKIEYNQKNKKSGYFNLYISTRSSTNSTW